MQESLFVRALGESPLIKVLDFLVENRIFDYSKTDIAREAGVSRVTLDSFWDNLVKMGIVKETRQIGRATLYKLNIETPAVKKMVEFDLALSESYAENVLGKGQAKAVAHA